MEPEKPTARKAPLSVEPEASTEVNSNAEFGSPSGSIPLPLQPGNRSTGSSQPSPLSQSTSAEDAIAGLPSSAPRTDSESPSRNSEKQQASDGSQRISDTPQAEATKQGIEVMAAPTESTPGKAISVGDTSVEASLEKEYHKENAVERPSEIVEKHKGSFEDDEVGVSSHEGSHEKRHHRKVSSVSTSDTDGAFASATDTPANQKPPRKLKTFEPLQRKKEERAKAAASEPTVTITGPGGEKVNVKQGPIYPNTSYVGTPSRGVSPNFSDSDDELRDIKHAQSLSIWLSPIDTIIPGRVIRTLIRGDFRGLQEEAKTGKRKLRTYFVATDISDEAAYALEWTIGTILRDGDTLLAIYAVDKDTGTGETGDPVRIDGLQLSEGALAMQDTTATMEKMTSEAPRSPVSPSNSGGGALAAMGFGSRSRRDSDRGSKESRVRTKAEAERLHAIDTISETCMGFLRKTRLQVRVTVEVISCKSPRHMITEAIDYFEPTLVILGSRGRGALKGTLLGSFSNYLVAKSSIPVMVARKKLKGKKAKNVNPTVRLANNLIPTTDSRLTRARID
ncbi:MAG: hypothetical protein Q9207_006097 [Kuettlingeria erythrocarpa]